MKQFLKKSFVLIAVLFSIHSYGQYSLGDHPSGIKWRCIKSENIRVIFPEGQEDKASRIATIIDIMVQNHTESIGDKKKKIDLVLQTNQVISNGYVALAPFRSEFFATAFQNNHLLGSLDWLDQLSIHEYRHIQQFANGRRGLIKFASYLEGQTGVLGLPIGWSELYAISVPNWYSEGDAVMAETMLSDGGRGRSPYFFNTQRALLLNDIEYKYKKVRNGSYEDLLPSHYAYGYTIINHARNNYGENIWEKVHREASQYRTLVYPFAFALKKHTGHYPASLYREANAHLKEIWQKELDSIELTEQQPIVHKPNTVTNYRNPYYLEDGSIVYAKSSYDKTPYLYQFINGKEIKLTSIGIEPEGYLTVNNNKATWTELKADIRRANRNYSVIMSFDIESKIKKRITPKGKYFSPHYASSGDQIVCVQANEELKNNILIIDANSGKTVETIANTNNDFIVMPKWTSDDQAIVYLAKRNSQLAFFEYDINTKETTQLSDWVVHNIGHFNIRNNTLYYSASYSGIDNIYELSLNGDRKINQISSVKIGAYMPDVSHDGTTVIMCEQTEKGKLLTTLDIYHGINKLIKVSPPTEMDRYEVSMGKSDKSILRNLPTKEYEVKKYRNIFRGLRLHSWSLLEAATNYELNLEFDNTLDNFSSVIGIQYFDNGNIWKHGINVSYSYLFPIFNLGVDQFTGTTFNGQIYSAGVSLPFRWVNGNYFTSLQAQANYEYQVSNAYYDFGSFASAIVFSNLRRTALQNVGYRGGQQLTVRYNKAVTLIDEEIIAADLKLFFPGIGSNHSIKITGSGQKELGNYKNFYVDSFIYARGYQGESLTTDRVVKASIDYQVPLFNIDGGFGGLIYFKRVVGGIFADISQVRTTHQQQTIEQNSIGTEFMFDTRFLTLIDLRIGVRNSIKFNTDIATESPISIGFIIENSF